jgi:hypothetical protein
VWRRAVGRRSFLKGVGFAGAIAAAPSVLVKGSALATREHDGLTRGDEAILRFLAAVALIESDLWQQYNELGGVNGGNNSYMLALQNLDGDMPPYISDNTDDEISHANFLNAYLKSRGGRMVNLDRFRTLQSSAATGAQQIGRLTNLKQLNVDTSWWTRYRSRLNPDFGATFQQALTIENQPAIPLDDAETPPSTLQPVPPVSSAARRMQSIANIAGFHFAFIDQGGASLYTTMSGKASSLEVLRIIVSIGGVEIAHFGLWHDKAGNAVNDPLAGVVDPVTGLTFPNLNTSPGGEAFQTNLILPEPAQFISTGLPDCSVIRPSLTEEGGAMAVIKADDGLFAGQRREFFNTVMELAVVADAAKREVSD